MAFAWQFVDLSDEQKDQRRIALDIAANVAQYSALIPLLFLQIYFLVIILGNKRTSLRGNVLPPSFYLNDKPRDKQKWIGRVRSGVTSFVWWAGTPVRQEWGTRGEWLLGTVWALWLLFLSVAYTGNDYFHVTKRFGIVAASQMPLHYLLALKHPYSPLQLLTRLSHEQLNRGHQILGRIITIFFYAHGVLYFNSFLQLHTVVEHLKGRVVLLGLLGLVFFAILNTTSLGVLRAWSYRIFFVTHIALAILLLPILFFHVSHIRLYIWECLAIYLVNAFTRYVCSRTYHGTVSLLPKGDLIKIDIPVDQNVTFWRAGDHVYLTLVQHRGMKTPTEVFGRVVAGFRSNPFTIASIPSRDGRITLVARVREGSTKRLASLSEQSVRLRLEGPYGAARYLPDLATFDEVLLVAGGAGATFVVPIFRDLISELLKRGPASRMGSAKLLWFVRNLADTDWAVPEDEDGKQIWEQNTEVVVTGARSSGSMSTNSTKLVNGGKEGNPVSAEREEIEMEEQEALLNEDIVDEESGTTTQQTSDARGLQGRARLFECMGQVFARDAEGSVALLVCGPPGMAHTARKEARRWAKKGRQVFFHAEEFGL